MDPAGSRVLHRGQMRDDGCILVPAGLDGTHAREPYTVCKNGDGELAVYGMIWDRGTAAGCACLSRQLVRVE